MMLSAGAHGPLMTLTGVDYAIIAAYFVISLVIGLLFSKRAGKSVEEYFISGRSLPWWLAGTSMVATTFAADTPLAVTGLVITKGIAGNWLWWSFVLGGMLTVFIYARMWRRAEVITDVELIDLRYSGKPAKLLRGFRALYLALPINCLIIGWVISAIVKVLSICLGVDEWTILLISVGVTAVYCVISGFWGIAVTDFFQFWLAMAGCIALAVMSLNHIGGMSVLMDGLSAKYGHDNIFNFVPNFQTSKDWMPLEAFIIFIGVIWWASWYPGAEPGGGGYVVQRMASCKDEKHCVWATLWFQIAHYGLRPWPWIIVALCALYMFPELRQPGVDADAGYPLVMVKVLTPGMKGLLLVTFFAAFMSTLSTHLNWGASYIVNDFYRPFIKPDAAPEHYTKVSRLSTVAIVVLGVVVSRHITEIAQAWKIMLTLGAGTGMVFMLRWFWWRINAWAEISAMVASFAIGTAFMFVPSSIPDYYQIVVTAFLSIGIWWTVMLLTPPEPDEKLCAFYTKVRPGGPGWQPIRAKLPQVQTDTHLGLLIVVALIASAMVYCILFGFGKILFGLTGQGSFLLAAAAVCGLLVHLIISKIGWSQITR